MRRHAIFVGGPVGSGKTTLGRALAARLPARFIDGDDLSVPGLPWYGSILRTSRAMVREGMEALRHAPAVVIAYPMNCVGWIYFRRCFGDQGVETVFVSLDASADAILDAKRGRFFSLAEATRVRTMVAEGYGRRPFSDLVLRTDRFGFAETLSLLEAGTRRLTAARSA